MKKKEYEIPVVDEIVLMPQSVTMQSTSGGDDPIHWGDSDNDEK